MSSPDKTDADKAFDGLLMVGPGDDEKPEPPRDFSWLLIAITRTGQPLIIDGAEDFWNYDLIVNGECAIDNGVVIPPGLLNGALYRLDKIRIDGGGPDHEGEYWGPEISSKKWTRMYPLRVEPGPPFMPPFKGISHG